MTWVKIPLPHPSLGSAPPSEETMESLCSLILSLLICNTGMLKATLQLLCGLEIVHVKTPAQCLEHKTQWYLISILSHLAFWSVTDLIQDDIC